MHKNIIRLTEGQLHKVIKESVKRVIKESGNARQTYRQVAELIGGDWNKDGIYIDMSIVEGELHMEFVDRQMSGINLRQYADKFLNDHHIRGWFNVKYRGEGIGYGEGRVPSVCYYISSNDNLFGY